MSSPPRLSVVVPVFDEEKNIAPLVAAVRRALGDEPSWELILVDDGSGDGTVREAKAVAAADQRIVLVELARNYGQAAATQAGFDRARAPIVVTLDGDLQNDPADIPELVARLDDGYDLVAGWRRTRSESLIARRLPSRVANWLIRRITGVPIRDNGCSLRAYRRDLLDRLQLYSDLHRYVPVVAATVGARITEMPVRHNPRSHGRSKYGLRRVYRVALDLLVLYTIALFRIHPYTLFGGAAVAALGMGIASGLYSLVARAPGGTPNPLILQAVGFLFVGLAGYLVMLALVLGVALRGLARDGSRPRPELAPGTP